MRTTGSFVVTSHSAKKPSTTSLARSTEKEQPIPKRETLTFDVVVVGAGPAGLATAYRLRTQGLAQGVDVSVCVVEKAARIGGHLLAGALLDPQDLAALVPDWAARGAPLDAPVTEESLYLLTHHQALSLPIPQAWRHGHCRMVSLGRLSRWLARLAEAEGVEIFPGFAATAPLWEGEKLVGVLTGDLGRDRSGVPKPGFQPGVILRASVTVLAEGCRGSLSGKIMAKLGLNHETLPRPPPRYALGFKELWLTPGSRPGRVMHTLGWPLGFSGSNKIHGGGFLYQSQAEQTVLGLVIDLDYKNPFFDPFVAMQSWKNHPMLDFLPKSSSLLGYGARTMTVGGWQSLPALVFAGGLLVGDSAGFLNAATLRGIGNALASGILAADAILAAFVAQDFSATQLQTYSVAVANSTWGKTLHAVRNVRPGFRFGLWPGLLNAAWEEAIGGRSPWTLSWHQTDREQMQSAAQSQALSTVPTLSSLTLDRATALGSSGLRHEENQPLHLLLSDSNAPLVEGRLRFANPETRFCPAGVFELRNQSDGEFAFHIHANHCLHCKCCDIKEPLNNIRWSLPQGGSGPNYQDL